MALGVVATIVFFVTLRQPLHIDRRCSVRHSEKWKGLVLLIGIILVLAGFFFLRMGLGSLRDSHRQHYLVENESSHRKTSVFNIVLGCILLGVGFFAIVWAFI